MAEKRKDKKGRILKDNERQRSDGKYEYRYEYAGQRRSVYSWKLVPTDRTPAGKRDNLSLREQEKAIERDITDGIDTARAAKLSLNALFEIYLETKTKVREKTREKYRQLWRLGIKDASLGNMLIIDIRKAHIERFYAGLSKKGHADATIRMYHNNLIMPSFTFAVDNDLLRKNPAKGCIEGYNGVNKKMALTIEEQEKFLKFIEESSSYRIYLPLFRVMIGTACRIGEICGLTWADVNMKKRRIYIDHQLEYNSVDGKMQYVISTPKTKSSIRNIHMTGQVYRAFVEQKKLNMLLGKRCTFEVNGYKDFVFLNANGLPFTTSLTNAVLKRVVTRYNAEEEARAEKAGQVAVLLPHISNHILRHTGCTRMAECGMDVKVLQTIMGHSNIAVTMNVYNHVTDDRMEKEMQKIEKVI